jgi:hypothetical protein
VNSLKRLPQEKGALDCPAPIALPGKVFLLVQPPKHSEAAAAMLEMILGYWGVVRGMIQLRSQQEIQNLLLQKGASQRVWLASRLSGKFFCFYP